MAQVQLTTDVKNFEYETVITGTNTGASPYNFRRYPTATRPDSSKGTLIFGGTQNYLKLQAFNQGPSTAQLLGFIYGWNFCSDKMIWVPQVLWSGSLKFGGTAVTLPFASGSRVALFETAAPTSDNGITNAKELQLSGENPSATLLVDCVGAQFIEFSVYNTVADQTDVTLHILYSSI
jgi:hypothetical protein